MSDLSSIYDFTLSITEACNRISEFDIIYSFLQAGLDPEIVVPERRFRVRLPPLLKPDGQYTEYQGQEGSVERPIQEDRIFPLETVTLKQFNSAHDKDPDEVLIHIGPYADEYARSLNALALTIGRDIFFRNNAFNTEHEEGRKTLAHELTHVAQYEEGRLNGNSSVEELEKEAAFFEGHEEYRDDFSFWVVLNNKRYKIKRSEVDVIAAKIAERIESKIYEQRYYISEEDYLKLLVEYETMLKEGTGDGIFDAF
jgi:hypothetical protein